MKFTETDMDDINSVLSTFHDLDNSGITVEHAVFTTEKGVKFLVTYEDPEFQAEILPTPDVPDTHKITFSDHGVKPEEWCPGWPPQGS